MTKHETITELIIIAFFVFELFVVDIGIIESEVDIEVESDVNVDVQWISFDTVKALFRPDTMVPSFTASTSLKFTSPI